MQAEIDFSRSASGLCLNTDRGGPSKNNYATGTILEEGGVVSSVGLQVVGNIFLHNRADLQEALREELSAERAACDGTFVLCAFRKWGEKCAEFLLGEFAFAIWDVRERRLFCCRDQLGSR